MSFAGLLRKETRFSDQCSTCSGRHRPKQYLPPVGELPEDEEEKLVFAMLDEHKAHPPCTCSCCHAVWDEQSDWLARQFLARGVKPTWYYHRTWEEIDADNKARREEWEKEHPPKHHHIEGYGAGPEAVKAWTKDHLPETYARYYGPDGTPKEPVPVDAGEEAPPADPAPGRPPLDPPKPFEESRPEPEPGPPLPPAGGYSPERDPMVVPPRPGRISHVGPARRRPPGPNGWVPDGPKRYL